MTSVLVMALCNQPKAFASDLGDNQSHYLFGICTVQTDKGFDEAAFAKQMSVMRGQVWKCYLLQISDTHRFCFSLIFHSFKFQSHAID